MATRPATQLEVLVVDDEPAIREVLAVRVSDWGYAVRTVADPTEALRAIDAHPPHVVLCDVVLPNSSGLALLHRIKERDRQLPVVMITAHGNIDSAVDAMKAGAADFLTKPLDYESVRALLAGIERRVRDRGAHAAMNQQLDASSTGRGIVGQSAAIRELRRTIDLVATSDASAIVTGESGTGKEVVARAIHSASARRDKPF